MPVSTAASKEQATPLTATMVIVRPPDVCGLKGAIAWYWPAVGTGPPTYSFRLLTVRGGCNRLVNVRQ